MTSRSNGVGVRTAREADVHSRTSSFGLNDSVALGISDTPE